MAPLSYHLSGEMVILLGLIYPEEAEEEEEEEEEPRITHPPSPRR